MLRNNELDPLCILALATRSRIGQEVLARHGERTVPWALATNTSLHPEVARTLVVTGRGRAAQAALLRLDDRELLDQHASCGGMNAPWALANPLVGVDHLEKALGSTNRAERYAALVNPSTPEEWRRAVLTPQVAQEVIESATSTTLRVARACELALANRWMIQESERYTPSVRRGVICVPGGTRASVLTAARGTRAPRVENHPAVSGQDPREAGVAALVELANPVVDLQLTERAELNLEQARMIAGPREGVHTEPHILARLVRRFGAGVLGTETIEAYSQRWAGTRISAAALVEPASIFAGQLTWTSWEEARELENVLDENEHAWGWMVQLALRSRTSLTTMASSAARLAAG